MSGPITWHYKTSPSAGGRRKAEHSKKAAFRSVGDVWPAVQDKRPQQSAMEWAQPPVERSAQPRSSGNGPDSALIALLGEVLIRHWRAPVVRPSEWAPVTTVRKSKETALTRGLTMIIDRAVPLLSEQDERRLVERLREVSKGHEDDIWAAVEYFMVGDGATKANIELGAALVIAFYEREKEKARRLIKQILRSHAAEELDRAVRIISNVEDPWFCGALKSVLGRDDIPEWLRETMEDTLAELGDL